MLFWSRLQAEEEKTEHGDGEKTFYVSGMHCEHCKNRIEEAVNCIVGVSATVNLKKNQVLVEYETPVDDASIINQIDEMGYTVTSVL